MCGIIGFSGNNFKEVDLLRGLKNIKHRGPDETISFLLEKDTRLGMVRLAIRDIRKNLYPFKYKSLSLIYNGEIYNQNILKKALNKKNSYQFKTSCDAEIILPLYHQFGSKSFKFLQGMFSIAILDKKRKEIIISRDIFGEKPLYYFYDRKSFFFSSEINGFPKRIKEISINSIENYLSLGFNPAPQTFFKNIYKVMPGQTVVFNTQTKQIKKINFNPIDNIFKQKTKKHSINEEIDKLEKTLLKIVKNKVVSDVPIGIFLSGGLDSSLLTALVKENNNEKVKTFSISFNKESFDESDAARKVSTFLKTEHHQIDFSSLKIEKEWEKIIGNMDELISDPALFPTYLLSKHACATCPVILTGEGADELFGGYDHYSKKNNITKFAEKILPKFIVPYLPFFKIYQLLSSNYSSVIYPTLWLNGIESRKTYLKIIESTLESTKVNNIKSEILFKQYYDLKNYVAEQLCMKIDKMTMQNSIESRAPFLDLELVKHMARSAKLIEQGKENKYLLKKVAKKYLPDDIIYRKKQGFSLPISKILKGPLKDRVESLSDSHPLIRKVISQSTINQVIKRFNNGNKNYNLTLWNILTLQTWLELNDKKVVNSPE